MPAFTSMSFLFHKPVVSNLVERFYRTFMNDQIEFKSVLDWGCSPDMTLEEIIEWNQGKVDSGFIAEMDTDVSQYERQVCLDVEPFSQCRIILSSNKNAVCFRCIVPEDEISNKNTLVFEEAALRVWDVLPVKLTETYGELGSGVGYAKVKMGVQPSTRLFAIVDKDCAKMASPVYYSIKKMEKGYFLKRNPKHKEPIIISETMRIAETIGKLDQEVAFSDAHISVHGITDALEKLINIINQTDLKLDSKDYHQLSFMAYQVGLEFPAES